MVRGIRFTPILAIGIVIVLIVIAAVGGVLVKKYRTDSQTSTNQVKSPNTQTEFATDSFTLLGNSYSVDYPVNWRRDDNAFGGVTYRHPSEGVLSVGITTAPEYYGNNLTDQVNQRKQIISVWSESKIISEEPKKVLGNPGTQFEYSYVLGDDKITEKEIIFEINSKFLKIQFSSRSSNYEKDVNIFERMVKSLEVVNK